MERILKIKVIPNAKKQKILEEGGRLKVYLTSQPEKGKANKELITLLSKYYNLRKEQIAIIKGEYSREKVIKIT